MQKLRVGVLMGGLSLEKEVSFNSGRTIYDHLDRNRYHVTPIFQHSDGRIFLLPWYFMHRGKISDFIDRLENEAKEVFWDNLSQIIDFMYLAVHGRHSEDGSIQGMLELLNIPYSGSKIMSSAISGCKPFHDVLLSHYGFKVPKGIVIHSEKDLVNLEEFIKDNPFPLIVKPVSQGSSIGVTLVNNNEELLIAIKNAQNIDPLKKEFVMIQEKINGMEFSCIAIEKEGEWIAFEPTQIIHKGNDYIFDYFDKYMPGASIKHTPALCSIEKREKIKDLCKKIALKSNIKDIVRIDGFVDEKEDIIIIETNIFPGTAPSSFTFLQAALEGYSHADLINHIIAQALGSFNTMIHNNNRNNDKKIRIGVILGGDSNEREISLESGRNVVYKLSSSKYTVAPLFLKNNELYHLRLDQLVKDSVGEIVNSLSINQKTLWSSLKNRFDFIFLALHGGIGENGTIQGALQTLHLPYNGSSVLASSLCMNKYKTHEVLMYHQLNVPLHIMIDKKEWTTSKEVIVQKIIDTIGIECIIKPYDDGCSCMVHYCDNLEKIHAAIETIISSGKNGCLVEECLKGIELTVGVIGNEEVHVLPLTMTSKNKAILSLEEKFLPGAGENVTPAPLDKEITHFIQQEIKRAYIALTCSGYARFDCFFIPESQKLVFLECNTLPALTPATCIFHQAAEIGMLPHEFIDMIIELGMNKHTLVKNEINQEIKKTC